MRVFFNILFLLFFVVFFFLALFFTVTKGIFLQPDPYKTILKQNNAYERARDTALETYLTEEAFEALPLPLLTVSEGKDLVRNSLPSSWIENIFSTTLDKSFLVLYGKDIRSLSYEIPLFSFKSKLKENFQRTLSAKINSLHACTQEQLLEIQKNQTPLLLCIPPGFSPESLLKSFPVDDFLKIVPDTLRSEDMNQFLENQGPEFEKGLSQVQLAIKIFQLLTVLLWAITVSLLVGIYLINAISLKHIFYWIGITLGSSSIIAFSAIAILGKAAILFLPPLLEKNELLPWKSLLVDIAGQFIQFWNQRFTLFLIPFFVAGTTCFALSFFIHFKKR